MVSPIAASKGIISPMILGGSIQLNKVSRALSPSLKEKSPWYIDYDPSEVVPDEAVAEILIAERNTADIFGRGEGTRLQDLQDIRSITEEFGFHHDGQDLTGMQVFDNYEDGRENELPLEFHVAGELRKAWVKAKETGQPQITGLFIGTEKLSGGRKIGDIDVSGRKPGDQTGFYQWSCAPLHATWYYQMNCDVLSIHDMPQAKLPSRPVALKVLPPAA